MRGSSKALGNTGEWRVISDVQKPYPLVYLREAGDERYCIAINPSGKKASAEFPTLNSKIRKMIIGDKKQAKYKDSSTNDRIEMAPVSAVIFKLEK